MTVRIEDQGIVLEGRCGAGDAEALLLALQDRPGATVDLGSVLKLHMAVLQVLIALRPAVTGAPAAAFLSENILRLISNGDKATELT